MGKVYKFLQCFGLFHKPLLPQQSLLTNNKSYIRVERAVEDIIYDQPLNESLSNRIDSVQQEVALEITGFINWIMQRKITPIIRFIICVKIFE